jgi:hypothetical protein
VKEHEEHGAAINEQEDLLEWLRGASVPNVKLLEVELMLIHVGAEVVPLDDIWRFGLQHTTLLAYVVFLNVNCVLVAGEISLE